MKPCSECGNIGAHYATCSIAVNLSAMATGEASAASPEKWDESQTEDYIPTLYDPITTAAHNDNDGKGVYYVARWKVVANGLLADGKTREEAVRALLDATSDWLGVFVATERKPAAASPEPVVCLSFPEDDIALIRGVPNSDDYWDNHGFCRIADMMEKYDLVPKDCGALYAAPTPNSEPQKLEDDMYQRHADMAGTIESLADDAPEWAVWIKGCDRGVLARFVCNSIDGDDCFGPFDERQAKRLCETLNRSTPNSETEEGGETDGS